MLNNRIHTTKKNACSAASGGVEKCVFNFERSDAETRDQIA